MDKDSINPINSPSSPRPIFAAVFGQDWPQLPPVLQKHYVIREGCQDRVVLEGTLNTVCGGILKWLSFIVKRLKTIPPFTENQVHTLVEFTGDGQSNAFHFYRHFQFKRHGDYHFRSKLIPFKKNEVVEHLGPGLGWHCAFIRQDEQIIIKHLGYKLCLFGKTWPLPITWLLGEANATETALDDTRFSMQVNITHPLWGKIYGYSGEFTVKQIELAQPQY